MCLIINRPANVKLDFEQFKVAMDNNPHGWGLSTPDGSGKLETFRTHEEADPEVLYKFVQEEFGEQQVLLHLRYTTAGETILRNSHPFPILEKSKDGIDLRMAHNGTLALYKSKDGKVSDTRNFVKFFVRPLFKRLIKGHDSSQLLKDKWIENLLDKELSAMSVLSFIDGEGNTLNVNALGNGGFYSENGVYYSNKYSFDPDHRKPTNYGYGFHDYSSTPGKSGGTTTTTQKTNVPQKYTGATDPKFAKDTKTKKFSDLYCLPQPQDMLDISDDFIDVLVDSYPEEAKLFIKEALHEWCKEYEGVTQ